MVQTRFEKSKNIDVLEMEKPKSVEPRKKMIYKSTKKGLKRMGLVVLMLVVRLVKWVDLLVWVVGKGV